MHRCLCDIHDRNRLMTKSIMWYLPIKRLAYDVGTVRCVQRIMHTLAATDRLDGRHCLHHIGIRIRHQGGGLVVYERAVFNRAYSGTQR